MGGRRCISVRSVFSRQKGSDSAETLVDEPGFEIDPFLVENLQATPGKEHMSSLRGKYLKLLADEHGLYYEKLDSTESLLSHWMIIDLQVGENSRQMSQFFCSLRDFLFVNGLC